MNCHIARDLLAKDPNQLSAGELSEARAHLADCPSCQTGLLRFSEAIVLADGNEIPCAESRRRMPAFALRRLNTGEAAAAEADPLANAHLANCSDCAAEMDLLYASLAALESDRLPEPAPASFDTRFARRSGKPSATSRRRRARPLAWLDRLRVPEFSLGSQPARLALAGLAVAVLLGFAGLLRLAPNLSEPIRTLVPIAFPSAAPSATLTQAEIAATQTVAAVMGLNWVDDAGRPLGTGTPGPIRSADPLASPGTVTANQATPSPGVQEADDDDEPDRRAAPPTPDAGLEPGSVISDTDRLIRATPPPAGTSEAYPPPSREPPPTEDPYPEPEDPEDPEPEPSESPPPEQTPDSPPADPTDPGAEPTETPGA